MNNKIIINNFLKCTSYTKKYLPTIKNYIIFNTKYKL